MYKITNRNKLDTLFIYDLFHLSDLLIVFCDKENLSLIWEVTPYLDVLHDLHSLRFKK
jgi:hypothetical protein